MAGNRDDAIALSWRGQKLLLRIGFRAIKMFEAADGERPARSIFDGIDHLALMAVGRVRPQVSMLTELLLAALAEHHPEIGPDEAMEMIADQATWRALFEASETAMPEKKSAPDEEGRGDGLDPIPAAARKRGGTGMRSSATGAKRASG
jgi:hypothetical protein